MSRWFNLHTHSKFSVLDAMPDVSEMVQTIKQHGQRALGLTDHGLMSGSLQLYKECKKSGLLAYPGEEFYVVRDVQDLSAKRYHLGMLSTSHAGYKTLVHLSSLSYRRDRYHYKPRIDLNDLAQMGEGGMLNDVIITTGCFFGLIPQTLMTNGHKAAVSSAKFLASVCPNVYIEIQHHNTPHSDGWDDSSLSEALYDVAYDAGLPVVVTQDSHYCHEEHKDVHDFMRRIALTSADDFAYPGDSYHLASSDYVRDHFLSSKKLKRIWNDGLASCDSILNLHQLEFPALDNYKFQIPVLSTSPNTDVRRRCYKMLKLRIPVAQREAYMERLNYELEIIKDTGFASYFLLVSEIVGWCRSNDIYVNARGSANGSLVCWLMGITNVDPIKWSLIFERFLTRDRGKPPDIDLDIEDTRRDDVINWISQRHHVVQLGTFNTLQLDEAGKGSLMQQYLFRRRRELTPEEFKRTYPFDASLNDVEADSPEDKEIMELLDQFKVRKAVGAHAAGFVLSSSQQPVHDYIPTMLIPSSGLTVTQMTMEDVEDAGYVKVDLLGLRTLSTIKKCLENLGRDLSDFCDWIPLNDKEVFAFMRKGMIDTGIFQFEGYTAAKGCRQVKVKSLDDLVIVNALYRPATINAGHVDNYLGNRAAPKRIEYFSPVFEKNLAVTFGVPVYQEQVMGILRDLGFPADDLGKMLKAIKASNQKIAAAEASFHSLKSEFVERCLADGVAPENTEEAWDFIRTFSEYSFNRAHSTAYGLLGYWTAYLKIKHPLEFHAALLETTAGTPKEDKYVKETRRMEVRLLRADVNHSNVSWAIDRDRMAIRRGLTSIKGIGESVARVIASNAPYSSLEDMIDRLPASPVTGGKKYTKDGSLGGVYAKLRDAGALHSLGIQGG